ncbi:MAG: hypothetical protein U9O94_09585 [Nanoarchaeota archaeon]|nr:hypothetical protein [Nanoarchaeota archaeon]
MFFKYHCVDDVDEMFALSGYTFVKKFSAPGNDVRLYQKIKYNFLSGILTFDKISGNIPIDKTIKDPSSVDLKNVKISGKIKEVIPNPACLSIESLYSEVLKGIPKGKEKDPEAPEKYHRIASLIINRVFRGSLSGMELKRDMDDGLKVVDTVFTNSAENGFFDDLANKFKINCPYIIVEAKNYSYDPKNREFDQLSGRLKDKIGKFGIQICREIDDFDIVKRRCESYLDDSKYIIVLTDEDLLYLLDLYQDDDIKGINEFMHKKIRPLIFKSKK